ncbi:MAG: hydrolase [Candidatus Marinimicrobia bacterium]|nr:hydrolase [Candidatus Neomarinimicrobiota bacterium]
MLNKSSTVLIVVDVQGKLAQIMLNKEQLFDNIVRLIKGCKLFDIPIIWMEQTPEKLGPTVPKIAAVLDDNEKIAKRTFSCCGEQEFTRVFDKMNRENVLICGIETHVCVYQTACDLLQKDYQVQVVTDAVASRTDENKSVGLERIVAAGGLKTTVELALFELQRKVDEKTFRELIKIIK